MNGCIKKTTGALLVCVMCALVPFQGYGASYNAANIDKEAFQADEEGFDYKTQEKSSLEEEAKEYINREIIVKLKKEKSLRIEGCQTEDITQGYKKVIVGSSVCIEDILKYLKENNNVLFVQPNYQYSVLGEDTTPNDPSFPVQWAFKNTGTKKFASDYGNGNVKSVENMDISLMQAWEAYQGGNETIVAILDTGVDYKHEDLKKNIWKNTKEIPGNGIDDDHNGYIDDVYGWNFYDNNNKLCAYNKDGKADTSNNDNHGTHCAGTIAAVADNNKGIVGIASKNNVKIMPIKVLGGKDGNTSTELLLKGISYAVQMKASIINASWGGKITSKKEDNALKTAIKESGILFVAAAGNAGTNNDSDKYWPACYSDLDNVIAVGSINCDGTLSKFSNYGKSVDLVAPGSQIYSTIVGGYGYMSGTSMAAPMVAGVAAMVYSKKKYLYPATVKQLLLESYKPIATVDQNKIAHAGVIDAYNAITNTHVLETDKTKPKILKMDFNYSGYIRVQAMNVGTSGICCIRIAYGKKSLSYFRRGARGDRVENYKAIKVSKSGYHTIYLRDNAGNAVKQYIKVTIDKEPPQIATYRTKAKTTFTITDKASGLAKVRYEYGNKSLSYFKRGKKGKKISIKKGKAVFTTSKKCVITIYAIDQAGHQKTGIFRIGN